MAKDIRLFNSFFSKRLKIVFFLVLPIIAQSQTNAQKDSIAKVPQALTISEIADYGQETRQLVAETKLLLENTTQLKTISTNLVAYDSLLENELASLHDTLVSYNLDQLDKLENQFTIYNNKVTPWIKKVDSWISQSDEKQRRIDFDFQIWRLTSDSIQADRKRWINPDSTKIKTHDRVNSQVESSLKSLVLLKDEFDSWINQLIDTENALTVTVGELNEAFSIMASKRQKFIDNIWIPEYPPIWKIKRDSTYAKNETTLNDRLEGKLGVIEHYIKDNSDFYYSLLFSFILILALILYIRKKAKQLYFSRPEVLEKDDIVLKFPLLTSFIILNFVVFIFYDIPTDLEYLILVISMLPFSLLLWELNAENKLRRILFFIVFTLTFTFLHILSEDHILLRYVLLVINGAAIVLLLSVQKNKNLIEAESTYWLGTLPFLVSLFIFSSIVAIIADIIGNVQLSLVLTRTTIGTFLAFTIIKESANLVKSFLFLFLMGPLFKFSNILKDDSEMVLNSLTKLLRIISYAVWIYFVLGLLKIRETLKTSFLNFINTPLEVGELSISLGNIITFYLIIQISIWLSNFIRYFLDKEVYPRTHLSDGVSSTFSLMIRYTIAFIGLLLALAGAGIELSKVVVGVGALGIGIGFGLQNIVNNFVSGIILALERPIKIGDFVKVDDIEGEVKDIGLRASQIRTWQGADVLVPNGYLISGNLTNWTFSDNRRRLDIEVRLPVGADITKASQVMLGAAASVSKILKKPAPYLNFEGVKDGTSVVRVYGWIKNFSDGMEIGTAFKIAVFDELKKAGFEVSAPLMDIQVDQKKLDKKS